MSDFKAKMHQIQRWPDVSDRDVSAAKTDVQAAKLDVSAKYNYYCNVIVRYILIFLVIYLSYVLDYVI